MRRLTLILSDLYLPAEAVPAQSVAAPIDLPGLSWLLRFASASTPLSDWRQWLAREIGDTLVFTEHDPVFTTGVRPGAMRHLLGTPRNSNAAGSPTSKPIAEAT